MSMRKKYPALLVLVMLVCCWASAAAAEKDLSAIEEILRKVDAQSSFSDTDLSAVMTMIIEDPEKGLEKIVVRHFRRDDGERFLLLIEEPRTQRGQGYLLEGDNLWFYDPSSRKFTHTSLKESFQGTDARNADFSQWSYSSSYKVVDYTEGVLGNFPVYIVDLEAVDDTVPYPFAKLWITKDSHLVLRTQEFSLNKRLMRSGLFPSYTRVGNGVLPVQMIFIDELVEGKKTQITLSEISTAKLPDHVFTKAFLERANR